ncbi:hypothetical protein H0H87_001980 [Tephrocybe sp. NHM501043]|nr:hypothetical protein H0H87_001980 [Tephrocybe sp. NHM501043]
MSPKWPYTVNTAVSLDSGPLVLLDLVDHSRANVGQGSETVPSQVIWGSGELPNRQHTLVISVGAGQPFAILDALVYTALDPEDLTTSTSASSTSASSSGTQTLSSTSGSSSSSTTSAGIATASTSVDSSKSLSHVLPIALGSVFGALALLLILLAIWFCHRRRRRPASEAWTVAGTPYSGPSPGNVPGQPMYQASDYTYTGLNQPYDNSWERRPGLGPIPGAMSPTTAAALAHPYANATPVMDEAKDDGWQGTTTQIAQRYMRSPNRYQPNTLSTITETSTPHGTPLAYSPNSIPVDLAAENMAPVPNQDNRQPPFPVLRTGTVYPQPPAYRQ